MRGESSPSSLCLPVLLANKEGRDPPLPPLRGLGEPKELGSECDRALGDTRKHSASLVFSFLLHRNTMNLLKTNIFRQQFGNQLRVPQPCYRRKTYLCYQLKQLDGFTLDKGCFQNKVPSGFPGHRASRGNRTRQGKS